MMSRRPGLALEQVAIAIGAVAILMSALVVYLPGRRDQAIAKVSIRDAQTIADAAVRFYRRTGAWPTTVAQLTARELPANTPSSNRFGFPYTVQGTGRHVVVQTTIPMPAVPSSPGTGVSTTSGPSQTVVTVTRSLTDEGTAAAAFWKKHLYLQ